MSYFPPGSCMVWGNGAIAATADVRFITPGFTAATAALTSSGAFALPKAGTLRNLTARHNSANGNGAAIVYDVLINGAPSGLQVSLATAAIGSAIDAVNTVAVVAGDIIEITGTKAVSIGSGSIGSLVGVEYI